MGLGIFIMIIIIVIALLVVGMVSYYGSQHDPHTSIRSVESSKSVQTLMKQADAAQKKLGTPASSQPDTPPATPDAEAASEA